MEDSFKNIELIEAYHEGRMSAEEKIDFEVQLLVDTELSAENELYLKILQGFKDIKADRIRTKLKLIDDELERDEHPNRKGFFYRKKKWLMSAAVVATAAMAVLLFMRKENPVPLPPEEGLPVLMGANDRQLRFDEAMQHFKNNEFIVAQREFNRLLMLHAENDTLLYFAGVAELYDEKYPDAIRHLRKVYSNNGSVFGQKASFYFAYACYQNGDVALAKEELQNICDTKNHIYQKEAQQFLQLLNAR